MTPFKKISNPRRLNLKEIWRVYRILGDKAFGDENYLIDEVDNMLDHINDDALLGVLDISYGGVPKAKTPIDYLMLFIKSLKSNNLLSFAEFVRDMK